MDEQSNLNEDVKTQSGGRAGDSVTAEHLRLIAGTLDTSAGNLRNLAVRHEWMERHGVPLKRIQELEQELQKARIALTQSNHSERVADSVKHDLTQQLDDALRAIRVRDETIDQLGLELKQSRNQQATPSPWIAIGRHREIIMGLEKAHAAQLAELAQKHAQNNACWLGIWQRDVRNNQNPVPGPYIPFGEHAKYKLELQNIYNSQLKRITELEDGLKLSQIRLGNSNARIQELEAGISAAVSALPGVPVRPVTRGAGVDGRDG